jgi:hypothetical protein
MAPPRDPPAPLTLEDLSENFPHIPPECGIVLVQSAYIAVVEFGGPTAKVVKR